MGEDDWEDAITESVACIRLPKKRPRTKDEDDDEDD